MYKLLTMWQTFRKSTLLKGSHWKSKSSLLKLLYCQRCSYHNISKVLETNEPEDIKSKIIYNSLTAPTHFLEVISRKKSLFKNLRKKDVTNIPVSLKLIDDKYSASDEKSRESVPGNDLFVNEGKPNLPYQYSIQYDARESAKENIDESSIVRTGVSLESLLVDDSIRGTKSWMNDYEKYCTVDSDTRKSDEEDWLVNYGTSDSDIPISDVACGGCGAYLHCQEPALPGYLPSEIFTECSKRDLESIICQRCHFLKNYKTALSVQVNPEKYVELITKIKRNALIILLVDLTDTPSSIWPGITEILGENRPIFLVGNKVDLLWGDSQNWLTQVHKVLRKTVPPKTNVIGSCLISAKTGFGIEDLVSKLHSLWKCTNDVYLVGCTNVGKSTLFNALIQSDYCKTKAVDLVQRATTAPWPGTTLNLLKFPILRPSAWKLAVRNARLSQEKSRIRAELELRKLQMKGTKKGPSPPQLIANISHSFKNINENNYGKENDVFSLANSNMNNNKGEDHRVSLVNSNIEEFAGGRWCFDTPGVLHKDQILDLLTTQELLLTVPKNIIEPRTFLFYRGMSLFIAGLARLDYTQGEKHVRLTVFCSNKLPITVCHTEHADELYSSLLGSELTLVPQGSLARLKEWPGLAASDSIVLCGVSENESCADVTFSSTGWISVTPQSNEICKFIAWSPLKRGINVRYPPILPYAVTLRGKKIPKLPAYSRCRTY